jgi:tetraacyldisaccharide 4'-kinase
VLSRGYGGRHGQKVLVVSDGTGVCAGPGEAGDEAFLLARRLDGVPVVVSPNRYEAGCLAHQRFGSTFFVLDDGYQHLPLRRDLDLVLMDTVRPFGNGRLLPLGPLREPVDHLVRGDAFVITRSEDEHTSVRLTDALGEIAPGRPVFRALHAAEEVVFPRTGERFAVEDLAGHRVVAFAGIARPEAFLETLEGLGVPVASFRGFRDHHRFTATDLEGLITERKALRARFLLTTEKDWVRMESLGSRVPELGYLTVRFEMTSGRDTFFEMVRNRAEDTLNADRRPR